MRCRSSFVLVLVLMLVLMPNARAEQRLADLTVVVYNKNVPESVDLARFYAQQRGIASDHLIGLDCSSEEEISREEYDAKIANPLREIFKARQWWTLRNTGENQTVTSTAIRFVAIIKGVPLKIRAATNYPGDAPGPAPVGNRNEASVDSELTVLGLFSRQISGERSNPYFQAFRAIGEFENAVLLLVCRLDAPTGEIVRRMITDAIATEKTGLWGRAYVDLAQKKGADFAIGEDWLRAIVDQLHKVGVPGVRDDKPEVFPNDFPMTDAALYYGWYAGDATGPFARSDFRFSPGAIAVHIHSFSAATLRDEHAKWVGPLLAHGAAASIGNVYEPYLQLTPHLDILNDRLLHGFTFAESAYMSTRVVSWMSVMVGDPLYRPYAAWLQIDSGKIDNNFKRYHEFAVRNATRPQFDYIRVASHTASTERNCAMLEDIASIEAERGNFAAAADQFAAARRCYGDGGDAERVAREEASLAEKRAGVPNE